MDYMETGHRDLLDRILADGKLTEESEEELKAAIDKFMKTQKSDILVDSQNAMKEEAAAEEKELDIDAARAEAEKNLQ